MNRKNIERGITEGSTSEIIRKLNRLGLPASKDAVALKLRRNRATEVVVATVFLDALDFLDFRVLAEDTFDTKMLSKFKKLLRTRFKSKYLLSSGYWNQEMINFLSASPSGMSESDFFDVFWESITEAFSIDENELLISLVVVLEKIR